MNPGASDPARQQLIDDAENTSPRSRPSATIWAGRPAMTPRDVVDNSYDVGLCVVSRRRRRRPTTVYQNTASQEFITATSQLEARQVYDFR